MPFPYDRYPWLNFQELNLAYFIKHFREIFQQWDQLYHDLTDWKEATDQDLADWKSATEAGLESWKTGLTTSLETWKSQTASNISGWETATLAALDAWKTATTTVFEQIRTEAAGSASAAAASASQADTARAAAVSAQSAAEQAAAEISAELAQIQTNTADIADLKSALTEYVGFFDFINLNEFTLQGVTFTKNSDGSYTAAGTATSGINYGINTFTLSPGTYLFDANADTQTTTYYLYLRGVNGTSDWIREGEPFTVTQDSTIDIRFSCPTGAEVNNKYKPSVCDSPKLTTATLQAEINDNSARIVDIDDILPKTTVLETVVNADSEGWTAGAFYDGGVGSVIRQATYAATSCKIYGTVNRGDRFVVTARSAGSAYAIRLCDNSNIVIDCFVSPTDNTYYNEEVYTVPADGIMYLNTVTAGYLTANKKYNLSKYVKTNKDLSSVLKGIRWYSIGDSLSEFNTTAESNWIKYLIANTEIDNFNVAKSGAGFYRGSPHEGQTQINYIKQLESVGSDAELITVAGSFNDLMSGPWTTLPIGDASDTGTNSIAGYMNAFFDALLTQFPTTPIGVYMTSPWDIYKPGVTIAENYVTVLKTICENRGVPFNSECFFGCNLKPWITANKTEYYTHPDASVDGVHPNSKGHVFLYRMLKPFLEKICYSNK